MNTRFYPTKGFSLIEVMVAVFILSLGLISLSRLQLTSLQFNYASQQRSLVLNQILEMADRMRANPIGVAAGNYNHLSPTEVAIDCTSACTPQQIAARDFNIWNRENKGLFTSGSGEVKAIRPHVYDLIIRWDSQRTGATGKNCSGNIAEDLTCVKMRVKL